MEEINELRKRPEKWNHHPPRGQMTQIVRKVVKDAFLQGVSTFLERHATLHPDIAGDVTLQPLISGDVTLHPDIAGDVTLHPNISGDVHPDIAGEVALQPVLAADATLHPVIAADGSLEIDVGGDDGVESDFSGEVSVESEAANSNFFSGLVLGVGLVAAPLGFGLIVSPPSAVDQFKRRAVMVAYYAAQAAEIIFGLVMVFISRKSFSSTKNVQLRRVHHTAGKLFIVLSFLPLILTIFLVKLAKYE